MAISSDKIKIDTPNIKGEMDTSKMAFNPSSKNYLRDTIITAIEVSKRSKVPCLFFSNPGYGKTTGINSYGAINGYHVETLIGSHYSPDEILGFQTNTGREYLQILEPEWFHRIKSFARPHYEKISSGTKYELVEDDDIESWKAELSKIPSKITERKNKINELQNKIVEAVSEKELSAHKKEFRERILTENPSIEESELDNMVMDEFYNVVTAESINDKINEIENEIKIYKRRINRLNRWLDDIVLVEYRKSILFLDELSTVSGNVQGALLQLCFERKIRGDKKLMDDCIVIAAANYKENLPGYSEIIAPELNRFCIVNLLYGDSSTNNSKALGQSMVNEFLQDFKEVTNDMPTFDNSFKFTPEMDVAFLTDVRNYFGKIFNEYTGNIDSSKGTLDLRNVFFDGIYGRQDGISEVLNFISARSLSYYARVVKVLCEMGIDSSMEIYKKFADGLVGLGTNSWDTEDETAYHAQIKKYHAKIYQFTSNLLDKYNKNYTQKKTSDKKIQDSKINTAFFNKDTISGKIKSLISSDEIVSDRISDTEDFEAVMKQISEEFDTGSNGMYETIQKASKDDASKIQFRSDFEQISMLSVSLSKITDKPEIAYYNAALEDILDCYKFYYNSLVMGLTKEQLGVN